MNLASLDTCAQLDERCVKAAFGCRNEVSVGPWRADLECGGVYIEVEPASRAHCGLGQAVLWRALGHRSAVVLFGEGPPPLPPLDLPLPVVYIDVKNKNIICLSVNGCDSIPLGQRGSGQDHHSPPRGP